MVDLSIEPPGERPRLAWWAYVLVLGVAVAYIGYRFVGLLTLGVFGYYATRPLYQDLREVLPSDGVAAWATLLLILLPLAALLVYAGFQAYGAVQALAGAANSPAALSNYVGVISESQARTLITALQNPRQAVAQPRQTLQAVLGAGLKVLAAVAGALLLVAAAVTVSYFLLKNDDDVDPGLRELFGGRDSAAYAYAVAVDEDLESIFFGNFVFVLVMAVVAAVAYGATNLLAPAGLRVPMIFVLAVLTGAASLVPIVVGKVVYVPVVAYLAFQAVRAPGNQLPFVGGVLVAYFLLLDILPQTFLQPYITGQKLDMVLMMLAYLLGPVLFGWYGFFLLPIVVVLVVEAVRIVLPELLHGEPLTAEVSMGRSIGADPEGLEAAVSGPTPESTPADDGEVADEATADDPPG